MIIHNAGRIIMNRSWKIVLALQIALTASISTLGTGSDFTLGIFGNADMDDTIDEKDVAYVQGVIKGTNSATNLSDANYDGAIDEKDLTQIDLIIRGKDTKLTFKDLYGDVVTVNKPIKRIVSGHSTLFQVLRALGAGNEIVGIDEYTIEMGKEFLQDFAELPSVGGNSLDSKDYETILALHPDVFLDNAWYPNLVKDVQEKIPGVQVIGLMCTNMPLSGRVLG
jgi:iron complex transport system substrate-binding protein